MNDSKTVFSLQQRASGALEKAFEQLGDFDDRSLSLTFPISKAAEMVQRSTMSIRRAESEGSLPKPEMNPSTGKRSGYKLEDINRMRAHFGTLPRRAKGEEPCILAMQNFKGGVSKTTLALHAAQYFALKGYRTLLIDADPQASTTAMMGLYPERDVDEDDTIKQYLEGRQDSLGYAIQATHWDGLDFIPSALSLYSAEYIIAAASETNGVSRLDRFDFLRAGVREIAQAYDIVIMDPPPALGMISLNVLRTINALLIPIPPSTIDYASTVSFLTMLSEVLEGLELRDKGADFNFIRLVATKLSDTQTAHMEMSETMRQLFGNDMLQTALLTSSVYDRANANMCSVYELKGGGDKTLKRCVNNLNNVLSDLELEIRKTWPSHKSDLRAHGMI